ncbi:MAG: hypothetical protein HC853_10995 [Anaerolineae bacterium]|nr:hypothetical protein [Anaerolineae bacterium]
MRHWLGTLVKIGLSLFALIIIVPLIGVAIECRPFSTPALQPDTPAPADIQKIRDSLTNYARPEDQTYLTLPEWYIVYSADEYAAFIQKNPPSQFPYFQAIGQFWRSYYEVCAVTRESYPFNSGYHLGNVVVGLSFTIENIGKGVYENTLGRLGELFGGSAPTEEELFARALAKDYGDFIHTIPWYEFPFGEKLNGLWQTSMWGPNPIRKWERKLSLSVEYGLKSLYGGLIKQASQATYGIVDTEIQVWATGLSEDVLKREPKIKIVKPISGQTAIASVPRYEEFTQLAPKLMRQGVRFEEIAGNDEILITAFVPRLWQYDLAEGKLLFELPILTQPNQKRIAVKASVKSLHLLLTEMERREVRLEHLYDY